MDNVNNFKIVLGAAITLFFILMIKVEVIVYLKNKPKTFRNEKELNKILNHLQKEAEAEEIYEGGTFNNSN